MTRTSDRRVLLTGFTAFGSVAVNPSQVIVERLAGCDPDVITAVLPVEYAGAQAAIDALLRLHRPDVVISLGVAPGRKMISLERVALNLDDGSLPDNTGVTYRGQAIDADGPAAYWSTLPLDTMYAALAADAIPVHFSNHAGTYVCNHVFYSTRRFVDVWQQPTTCGFVHIPAVDDTHENGLPLEVMLRAVQILLKAALYR
jgi:pyroglutamyl-peptidase